MSQGFYNDDSIWVMPEQKAPEAKGSNALLTGAVLDAATDEYAGQGTKSDAMAIALQWVEDGEFTFDALDSLTQGMMSYEEEDDEDPEDEPGDDDYYNDLMGMVGNAFIQLGGAPANVQAFINEEDDDAGEILGNKLSSVMDSANEDDSTLIANFAVGGMVLDSLKKVVRDGEIVWTPKKKRRLTAAQRRAMRANIKKARLKSGTAAARLSRKRSMRKRKSFGMK